MVYNGKFLSCANSDIRILSVSITLTFIRCVYFIYGKCTIELLIAHCSLLIHKGHWVLSYLFSWLLIPMKPGACRYLESLQGYIVSLRGIFQIQSNSINVIIFTTPLQLSGDWRLDTTLSVHLVSWEYLIGARTLIFSTRNVSNVLSQGWWSSSVPSHLDSWWVRCYVFCDRGFVFR